MEAERAGVNVTQMRKDQKLLKEQQEFKKKSE
jgi:hypothetical protein